MLQSALIEYELVDIYMVGLKCSNNHYFHIDADYAKSNDLSSKSEKGSVFEIAKDWLTDKNLRNSLQNQLAEILRKYIDSKSSTNLIQQPNDVFSFCPICSLELKKFEQDDVWVEGLKCSNDHTLYSRNGLNYNGTQLTPDISEQNFQFLLNAYLEEKNAQIPPQVQKLLVDINDDIQKH